MYKVENYNSSIPILIYGYFLTGTIQSGVGCQVAAD